MPRYLFTCLLCVFSLSAIAQVVAVQVDKENILYTCVYNTITVAVSNVPATQIVVKIDSGSVEYADPGHYIVRTNKVGTATIYISRKTPKGLKLVGSMVFRVKRTPLPGVSLNGKRKGDISKSAICSSFAPSAIMGGDIEGYWPIKVCTVSVFRDKEQIFTRRLHGENDSRIDSTTNDFFTTLENGDSVVFNNFIVKDCCGERTDVNSLEFTITEAEKYHKPPPHKPGDIEEIIDPVTGESHIKKW